MRRFVTEEEEKKLEEWNSNPNHTYCSVEALQDMLDWCYRNEEDSMDLWGSLESPPSCHDGERRFKSG